MALAPWFVPRVPTVIVVIFVLLWLASWKMARDGYKYRLAVKWAAAVMVVHGIILIGVGYLIWPRITVSPARIGFRGFPGETFNFSVRNGRADDVYDVQVPFLIGYGKHLQDKIFATVSRNGEPPRTMYNDYTYCFGHKGDGNIRNIPPNEREVLTVNIPHMNAYGSSSFTITYAGGESFEAVSQASSFIDEPYPYSKTMGTVGVRGDYRICKFVGGPNGGGQ